MSAQNEDWEKERLRAELTAAYERLAAMGEDVFWSNHYRTGRAQGTVLDIDFPVRARSRDFSASPHARRLTQMLDADRLRYRQMLADFYSRYGDRLHAIPLEAPADARDPHWLNGWLPGLDGVCIYSFIADLKPRTYFEVGSGNSTKFARRAISDFGLSTRVSCRSIRSRARRSTRSATRCIARASRTST